jgi:tetratricopeptide (TPR) repeat protein
MSRQYRTAWLGLVAALLPLAAPGFGRGEQPEAALKRQVEADLAQAETHMKAARWCEVRIALARAEGRLAAGGPKALRERVAQMRKDVEMIERLDAVRLRQADSKKKTDAGYAEVFRAHGIDVTALKPDEATQRVRASAIHKELLAALDRWALAKPAGAARKTLWTVADGADTDEWRRRLRQAVQHNDRKALATLARAARGQTPERLVLLAEALGRAGMVKEAEAVLRRGQWEYPADFWLNHALASLLVRQGGHGDEAVGFYRAALAVRPNGVGTWVEFGTAFVRQGKLDEAIQAFRRAIMLDPRSAATHLELGIALRKKGMLEEAIACFRKALLLQPNLEAAKKNLDAALEAKGPKKPGNRTGQGEKE